jgi:hypothetical protein
VPNSRHSGTNDKVQDLCRNFYKSIGPGELPNQLQLLKYYYLYVSMNMCTESRAKTRYLKLLMSVKLLNNFIHSNAVSKVTVMYMHASYLWRSLWHKQHSNPLHKFKSPICHTKASGKHVGIWDIQKGFSQSIQVLHYTMKTI